MKTLALVIAISMLAASTALAAGTSITMATDLTSTSSLSGKTVYGDKTAATASTPMIGKTSTGVSLGMLTSAVGYALITQHKNGTKAFGSSFDSTSIFSQTAVAGTALKTVPTTTGVTDFSSWSTM